MGEICVKTKKSEAKKTYHLQILWNCGGIFWTVHPQLHLIQISHKYLFTLLFETFLLLPLPSHFVALYPGVHQFMLILFLLHPGSFISEWWSISEVLKAFSFVSGHFHFIPR